MTNISRRGLFGILAAACAPAIIRTPGLIMPIKPSLALPVREFTALYTLTFDLSNVPDLPTYWFSDGGKIVFFPHYQTLAPIDHPRDV